MKNLPKVLAVTTVMLGTLAATSVQAHGIWFAQRANQLALVYGVGADDLDMVKRLPKMESFTGYDENWNKVDAKLITAGPMVLVGGDDFPVAVSAVMNNGIWSKTADGKWHAKGKDEVPDAIISQKTYKYAVHYRGMLPQNIPSLPTQKLQIIPVAEGTPALRDGKYDLHGDSMPVEVGDHLKIKVLFEGKPVSGAHVKRDFVNDADQQPWTTGEDGTVTIRVRNQGLNVIGATYVGPPDEPKRINEIEHFATLSFVLPILPE
tara:strand:+ start:314 stop:1102 length:789 start_codon:yes stop_codon:yes gene_type:complete